MTRRTIAFAGLFVLAVVSGRSQGGFAIAPSTAPALSNAIWLVPQQCYRGIPCVANRCIPIPTSLAAVDTGTLDPNGWLTAGGHCGVRRCWIIFWCACGPPLGTQGCR
jgi:hypothetical protein